MSPISSFLTIEESADEHKIGDEYLTNGYLTEKEQHQLLLDEEALREMLKEEARDEKEWEERIKKEQAHDELFRLEFKISFDLNEPKDSSKTDKAAQNGRTPKSLTLEIHHGGCFTPIPSRSYVGRQVSSVNVVDIDEFCLHDLKDLVVKLGYGVADLQYYHFLIPRLGLDYSMHRLNVDADVLEMVKYVKDYKIILVYVEHKSSNANTSIFVTPKKRVAIAVDNHLRRAPIEIDSSPDVYRNLTPMYRRNLKKEWEQVSSNSLSIGEVMKILSKKQPASFVKGLIVVESADYPFEDLNEILGDYANIRKLITGDEITGKQMLVHVGNSSTVDDVLDLQMLFETEGVGPIGKFKEVEVDVDNKSEEESDTEGNYTSGSDSEDSNYDPKHDDVTTVNFRNTFK
ncbi:hypothetical protein Tco_0139611 [Tanacetum coccineum]